MSKPSRRPTREAPKEPTQKRREAQRCLRAAQAQAGVVPLRRASISNRLCPYPEADEQGAREEAVAGQLGVFRQLLPKLLKDLGHIPDPRQPKKVKHKLTGVLLYGLLSFVLQMTSRREANRELSRPAFVATLQELFPELETLPHADTLHRLLSQLDVTQLEQAHVALIRRLIRGKKFRRSLSLSAIRSPSMGRRSRVAQRSVSASARCSTGRRGSLGPATGLALARFALSRLVHGIKRVISRLKGGQQSSKLLDLQAGRGKKFPCFVF